MAVELELTALTVERPLGRSDHVDAAKVRHYADILDQLPPVVVFKTEDGLMLVDGYHRVAAAHQLGRRSIPAEIRSGSRTEALAFAVQKVAAERGLSSEQAREAIFKRADTEKPTSERRADGPPDSNAD